MAYRSVWKGYLKLAQIMCPVTLYAATGELERQKFSQISKKTLNKVDFLRKDSVTGEELQFSDLTKGIEVAAGKYTEITEDDISACAPRSAFSIEIEELVPPSGIGFLFPDSHYYLGPDGLAAGEAFALLRDGVRSMRRTAIGQLSLGTREHIVALAPVGRTFRLSTLRYAAEVRDELVCFPKLVDVDAPADLIPLVQKILEARSSDSFDPSGYRDRYAEALGELVKDRISGRMVKRLPPAAPRLIDLRKAVKRAWARFAFSTGAAIGIAAAVEAARWPPL
jgi:DNA end-binding protein Ku